MHVSDEERRGRLVARHHLARTARDAVEAVEGVVAQHSSDPVTPYLSARARIEDFEISQLDHDLFQERSLWRMHAMRRTLFVVPTTQVPIFEAGASRDIARKERKRLEGWLADVMPAGDVGPWLDDVSQQVIEAIGRHGVMRTQDLVAEIPQAGRTITVGSGRWTSETPVSSRLLFLLAMEGHLVRARQAGSWRSSQYGWATTTSWLGGEFERLDEDQARVALAKKYVSTHGPVTMTDLRWWTGWTAARSRAALAELEVATVELDSGAVAYVLADDRDDVDPPGPAAAFLPGLDPTPMGWKERAWYLGPHGDRLFDSNGNAGPTVWLDGRVVGGWAQRPDGTVVYELLEDVDANGATAIESNAGELTAWLDGMVVAPRFRSPLERELSQ